MLLQARVNGDLVTGCEGIVIQVLSDRVLSVPEFMYAVGYDLDEQCDLNSGYDNDVTGFYVDDNGDCCFDVENCEIEIVNE